jgi:iron complex outermembrane receptor protein
MAPRLNKTATRRYRNGLLAGAALCAASLAGAASAQQAPSDATEIDEIIVTATRRAESVADIPYNIQAVSGAQLEKTGATTLADFVRTVPGISFQDRGASLGMDITLRGLKTTALPSVEPTTAVYIDDVEIPASFDPRIVDIDRVEVLRGPQGTLYGSGAIGGAVRYVSKKPLLDRREGQVTGEIGATEHGGMNYGATGMFNAPLVEDRLALRANVGWFDNSGFIDNVARGDKDVNWDRAVTARLALLAKPTENLEITLAYFMQNTDFGSDNFAYEDLAGDYANDNPFLDRSSRDQDITSLTATYDFGFASLTSTTSYRRYDNDSVRDITFFVRDGIYASFLPTEFLDGLTSTSSNRAKERYWTQEFRLVSNNDGPLSWIAGAYWEKADVDTVTQERIPIPFGGQPFFESEIGQSITDDKDYYFGGKTKFEQYAVFGEVGYQFTPKFKASLGARWFNYESSAEFFSIDQYFAGRNPDGTARMTPLPDELAFGAAEAHDTIFRLNASYKLDEDKLVYGTVAQGFRPGGYNLVGKNTGISADQFAYDPDSVINYEAGLKGYFFDHRLYFSGSVYYIDWSDIQTRVLTPTGFAVSGNAGKAHSSGIELEASARNVFIPGMTLSAGYAFTSVELDETVPGLGQDGERAPYVPRHSGSFNADYVFPLFGDAQGGLNFQATYTGGSATEFGAVKPNLAGIGLPNPYYLKLDAYWLLDVSARVERGPWTARLGVQNLLDEYADIGRTYQESYSALRDPYVSRTINRPRTVTFTLTRRF